MFTGSKGRVGTSIVSEIKRSFQTQLKLSRSNTSLSDDIKLTATQELIVFRGDQKLHKLKT